MSNYFHYFDQFKDVEIDLSPYLKTISTQSDFTYSFTNIQPVKTTLKNMFEKVELVSKFKSDILKFKVYTVNDMDRLDSISYKFYETVDYWWLICIFNDIRNVYLDFPETEDQLLAHAKMLYQTEGKYPLDTYYNLLFDRNEKKRTFLILKPDYINDVITAFRNEIA